ncbi:MAG: regulator, partial [bacterium]
MKTHGTIRAVVAIVALLAGGTVARTDTNPVYATRIAAVANNSFLVKADGTAWACGANNYGQIGDGTSGTNRVVAVQVSGLSGVTNISAGAVHAVALKSDGNLWAWGGNWQGQLGFGPDGNLHPIPVQVSGISDVKTIAVGYQYNFALKSDGSLWHWGDYASAPHPTPADTGIAGVSQVACGNNTKFVVKGDGTVWGWGVNY